MTSARKRSKYSGPRTRGTGRDNGIGTGGGGKGSSRGILGNLKAELEGKPNPYGGQAPWARGRPPMPPKAVLIAFLMKVFLDPSYDDAEAFSLD